MLVWKVAGFFVAVILTLPSLGGVNPSSQQGRPDDTTEPRIALGNALPRVGNACGCFFTLEEASRNGETRRSMEAAYVPERIRQSPQQAMDAMTVIVPTFTYAVDEVDSRIIHIKDKRLSGIEHYGLDQTIGPFESQGDVGGLVNAIAKLGFRSLDRRCSVLTN